MLGSVILFRQIAQESAHTSHLVSSSSLSHVAKSREWVHHESCTAGDRDPKAIVKEFQRYH